MADWSSLPSDLLRRVSDSFLDDNDVDCYLDMRAVCQHWRTAVPKPCPLGAGGDELRFRPRQWIMLDEDSKDYHDGRRLFLNVFTGRFIRRGVPLSRHGVHFLRHHDVAAASDGLLVLRGKEMPRTTLVLDPFTGSTLNFYAPIRRNNEVLAAVIGPAPTLVLQYCCSYGADLGLEDDDTRVYFLAGPARRPEVVKFYHESYNNREMLELRTIVAHEGSVYMVDMEGLIFRIFYTGHHCGGKLVTKQAVDFRYDDGIYLVESARDLLLIRRRREDVQVYRVQVHRGLLEPVHSIGGRALFLGHRRCLSVDADKFPSVDRNCIYHTVTRVKVDADDMGATYRYDLDNDGSKEEISWEPNPWSRLFVPRPHSTVQILLNYCKDSPPGDLNEDEYYMSCFT